MTNKSQNTAANNTATDNAAHEVIPQRSTAQIAAHSFVETVKHLREQNAHPDYIKHLYANELQTMIEPAQYGEFNGLVNKRAGLHYTVNELKDYDLSTPVLLESGVATPIEVQRKALTTLEARMKRGETLSGEEMTVLNVNRSAVKAFDTAVEKGVDPKEAADQANDAIAKEIERSLIGLDEASKGWLQPKFIAAGTALAAAGFNIVANKKFTAGAIAGGLTGTAVSYFGAEYMFTNVEAVRKLPELVKTALAASAGTGLGLGGVFLGEYLENRFFGGDIIDAASEEIQTIVDNNTNAIPAATAELAAYL